jgi:peroxiredoxin
MRADILPGSVFPDYELSDHTATRRKLSDLQGRDPMVLVLSRGGYCPKDRRQAELLVQLYREIEVAYCRLKRDEVRFVDILSLPSSMRILLW